MTAYGEIKKHEKVNVLVSLKSFLLCEALCKSVSREMNGYKAFPAHSLQTTADFRPNLLLVDSANLNQGLYLKWPDGRVLLIDTGLSEEEAVSLMRSYKLYGVISLDAGLHQLKKALDVIQDGQIWIDNTRLKAILHGSGSGCPAAKDEKLSKKENQIVELVSEGFKNKEIASMLFLSEQTIKSHLGRIFKKMNVTNRSQLVSLTIKRKTSGQQSRL
jgi:DNA-binding NarL/FixJ family response regulator